MSKQIITMPTQLFTEMPDSSKLLVFTSDVILDDSSISELKNELNLFLSSWSAHGTQIVSKFIIISQRVLVIAIDENSCKASGCSLDSLNRFISEKGTESGIDWFNRNWVLFKDSNIDDSNLDDNWNVEALHNFWAMRKAGLIKDSTKVLNTTVTTLSEARLHLVQSFSDSWHSSMW